ncbi:MAG: WxL domain-containing protein [Candidatus Levyibacteriota bacterium]
MKIQKGIHHLKYTRPQWYKDYHQWEHHAFLHWATFVVSSIVITMGFVNIVFQMQQHAPKVEIANAASTVLTQNVNGGTLTISNNGNQALSAATVSTSNQNTTGSLGTITVTDNRGTGAGWNATATSTHFLKFNAATKITGANSTVSTNTGSSTWSGVTGGTYTITIATGGSVGTATFNVTGLESASNVPTGSGTGIAIGIKGLLADFNTATYVTGDSWTIRVDVIPVTGLQITPGAVSPSTGITGGSVHTFTTTTDPASLMSATAGNGLGSYTQTPSLQLTVPANSYANSYTATVTETVL